MKIRVTRAASISLHQFHQNSTSTANVSFASIKQKFMIKYSNKNFRNLLHWNDFCRLGSTKGTPNAHLFPKFAYSLIIMPHRPNVSGFKAGASIRAEMTSECKSNSAPNHSHHFDWTSTWRCTSSFTLAAIFRIPFAQDELQVSVFWAMWTEVK